MKLNESESLYENVESNIWNPKRGRTTVALDKCRSYLITDCMDPGVKMARSYIRHSYGTWEAVVAMLSEKSNWRPQEDESSDAQHSGGLHCSSYEAFVMKVERRVQPILNVTTYQRVIG